MSAAEIAEIDREWHALEQAIMDLELEILEAEFAKAEAVSEDRPTIPVHFHTPTVPAPSPN